MQNLKKRITSKKENIYTYRKNSDFVTIKTKNTCHYFKIFFTISYGNSISEEFRPKNVNDLSGEEIMIVKAELLNKNEFYFNENNEEIELSEKYYEIYSLAELKNNIKGFEWFNKLSEFKEAFLNSIINNNKYELLLIKNILLFSIEIVNIFGINKNSFLILRPYIYNTRPFLIKNDNFYDINNNGNNYINKKPSNTIDGCKLNIINNNDNKRNKYPLISVVVNNDNKIKTKNKFLDKKRLKSKKYRINKFSGSINGTPTNTSRNNENFENKENIANMIDDFLIGLKDDMKNKIYNFEVDALSKYSSIIRNDEEESIIGDMISILKVKKYRLLYKATRDGDSASKFHSMCDNYNNLIVLIETREGLRFGGFTSSKFKGSAHLKRDNNAFLFSLDLQKVYKIMPEVYAIYCYPNSGPSFSRGSMYVPDHFFEKYGKTGTKGGPYQFEFDYELNNGKKDFIVKELEVFQVKIGED